MDAHRLNLIENLKLKENSLSWEFVTKSRISYNEKNPAWFCHDIPKKTPGIYSVATDTEFLYIGFSGSDIRNRFQGSNGLSCKVKDYLQQQDKGLQSQAVYAHWMPFSVDEPIGQVYATHTGNYHESILMGQIRPILNKQWGSGICFDEEMFYRQLIVKTGTTDGFSKYLVKSLLSSQNLIRKIEKHIPYKWEGVQFDLLLRLTNHIIECNLRSQPNPKNSV